MDFYSSYCSAVYLTVLNVEIKLCDIELLNSADTFYNRCCRAISRLNLEGEITDCDYKAIDILPRVDKIDVIIIIGCFFNSTA